MVHFLTFPALYHLQSSGRIDKVRLNPFLIVFFFSILTFWRESQDTDQGLVNIIFIDYLMEFPVIHFMWMFGKYLGWEQEFLVGFLDCSKGELRHRNRIRDFDRNMEPRLDEVLANITDNLDYLRFM
jgi:hypothetical protein